MKALFFDIDGTLWDKENVVPESTKEAIRRLKENGHLVFICSGRTRVFIQGEQLLGMGFDGILSGCGTYLEFRGQELLYKTLETELLEQTVNLLYDHDIPMIMEGRYVLYMDEELARQDEAGAKLLEMMRKYRQPIRENTDNWEASKFSVIIKDREYKDMIEVLEKDYEILNHGGVVMELVPKGYSKASAIREICERLNIDRADTYAFGDSVNDIEMLDYAGTGVVMGNGTDVAKQHGDYVTDDIHADGIYNACKHFGLI